MRSRLTALRARIVAAPLESWITAAVVVGAVAFTFAQLHPNLIFRNTTPTGGDMGAHVWSGTYLRDHLLPHGRLSGWTPDWYAGAPAFHFYMVVPFLADPGPGRRPAVRRRLQAGRRQRRGPPAGGGLGLRQARAGCASPGPPMLAAAHRLLPLRHAASRSTAATSPRRWRGSSPSPSASPSRWSTSGSSPGACRPAGTGPWPPCCSPWWASATSSRPSSPSSARWSWSALRPPRLGALAGSRRCRWPALLGAFWALPFVWRRAYMNDMGWEKIQPWSHYRALVHRLVGAGSGDSLWPWDNAGGLAAGPGRGRRRDRRPQATAPLPGDHDGAGGRGLRAPAAGPAVERPPPALLLPGHSTSWPRSASSRSSAAVAAALRRRPTGRGPAT